MYLQWEIYIANLNPTLWSEQSGMRPIVIISGNAFNTNKSLVMVCPITSKIKKYYGDIILKPDEKNWLTHESEVLWFQIRTITTERLSQKIGCISLDEIKTIIKWIWELLVL